MASYKIKEIELLSAFGKKLKIARLSLGLSQEKLAENCGLHRTYVASAERGERNISLLNLVKIAEALKVKPSELID